MSRKSREEFANRAAAEASEAGRILQAQRQEPESVEPAPEPSEASTINRPTPTPQISEREQVLQELRKNRGEVDPDEAPKADAPAPVIAAAIEDPAALAVAPEAPKMVKVKVDGEEFEAPEADVEAAGGIKIYQLEKAAEKRLKNANEVSATAKRTAAETTAAQAQLAQWLKSQQPPPAPKLTSEQKLAKLAQARFGSDEDFSAAMNELISGTAAPVVNPEHITTQVMAEIKFSQARAQFSKEFEDILSNPLLGRLAKQLQDEGIGQLAAGPNQWQQLATVDFGTFFRNIGNQVRSVSVLRPNQPAPNAVATATDPTSPVLDKEARKSSIVNLPTAAARASLPEEEKPETRAESLDRMRKARGLPTG